jgi:hypothetical protein
VIISGCGTENREALLKHKFNPDEAFHFEYNCQITSQAFDNDELVYAGDSSYQLEYDQEVVENLGNDRARCRLTYADQTSGETWVNEFIMAANGEITDPLVDSTVDDQTLAYYQKLLEQAAPEYPSEPVGAGFTWNHDVRVLLKEGPVEAKTTYQVSSFVSEMGYDCAVIKYHGTMYIPLGNRCPDDRGMVTAGTDEITTEGVLYFALKPGLVIKQEETSRLTRSGSVTRNGESNTFRIIEDRSVSNYLAE